MDALKDTRHLHTQERLREDTGEGGHLQAKERGLRRNPTCPRLGLRLPASTMNDKSLWLKSPRLRDCTATAHTDYYIPTQGGCQVRSKGASPRKLRVGSLSPDGGCG